MRFPRFHGLRRRLSYANVMATLALFFALTGTAAAATKYLIANDPITQGDLAGSTYGIPVIAEGKVTTGKIADGAITSAKFSSAALAPNAAELDGLNSTAFPKIVATGSFSANFGNVAPGQCATASTGAPAGVDERTDFVVPNIEGGIGGFSLSGDVTNFALVGVVIEATMCNGTSFTQNPGTQPINYLVVH